MDMIDAVEKQEQQLTQTLARLERNLTLEKIKQRKQDTRRKIELGGLVIKAKMNRYSKAIILGALIDALENLERDDAYQTLFKAKGEAAFMGFGRKNQNTK